MSTRLMIKAKQGRVTALLRWRNGGSRVQLEKTRPNIFADETFDNLSSNVIMFRHAPAKSEELLRSAS